VPAVLLQCHPNVSACQVQWLFKVRSTGPVSARGGRGVSVLIDFRHRGIFQVSDVCCAQRSTRLLVPKAD
jgi:hypothetical protein